MPKPTYTHKCSLKQTQTIQSRAGQYRKVFAKTFPQHMTFTKCWPCLRNKKKKKQRREKREKRNKKFGKKKIKKSEGNQYSKRNLKKIKEKKRNKNRFIKGKNQMF